MEPHSLSAVHLPPRIQTPTGACQDVYLNSDIGGDYFFLLFIPQCVPFCSPIFGGLCEGKKVLIQAMGGGVWCSRFSVNLVCANGDIAFHFNPRFDEGNVIVCNTQEKGCWGPEERTSPMLFQRGVSVNGSQFIDYQHRLPMNLVQTLQIKGDVSLSCINFTGGFVSIANRLSNLQVKFASMDFVTSVAGNRSFCTGAWMMLASMVIRRLQENYQTQKAPSNPPSLYSSPSSPAKPHSLLALMIFHVNLKNILLGNIALHVNPRFKERALVRNSFINGAWGSEERNIAFLPFCPGQAFQVRGITYLENCYQMLVNGQLKFEYIHRIPPSQVDQLEIAGDVTLSCVQY
uniref:Galectin n=1 Tax=Naja naja TaxID=35670 RepID=A0A8C6Y2B3_NAJNA